MNTLNNFETTLEELGADNVRMDELFGLGKKKKNVPVDPKKARKEELHKRLGVLRDEKGRTEDHMRRLELTAEISKVQKELEAIRRGR